MENAVTTPPPAGLFRILAALFLITGFWVHDGFAASVRFEILPDRERVTVGLNNEEGFAGQVKRVGPKALLLDLGVPTDGMGQDLAPENSRFFAMSEPRGRALGLFMRTAAFGFVVTRPDKNTVVINAYADPLGERWTPQGLASAPVDNAESGGSSVASADRVAPSRESSPAGDAAPPPATLETPQPQAGNEPAPEPSSEPRNVLRGRIERGSGAQPLASAPQKTTAAEPGTASPAPEPSGQPVSSGQTAPAVQPARGASPDEPGVGVFRSRINRGTLADWETMRGGKPAPVPSGESLPQASRGSAPTPAAPSGQPAGGPSHATAEPASPPAPTKVYVDEKGNPVPPPPDPVEAFADIHKDISARKYKDALGKLTPLLVHPELTREQMEEVLHLHAEMLFMTNQDKLVENFDAITSATIAAMNYNQDSPRNAGAHLRLGYINLQVGNTVEADAYFTRLRRQFPLDENIALTFYYWGNYYYDRGEMQKAADEFQYIVSNFSEHPIAREASIGLARCYNALGYYQEAFDIIDYIDRRWPRLYLESPSVLELMGDIAFRKGDLDFALDKYLTYYNLMPSGPTADVILSRIGDVHTLRRQPAAAKVAYSEAERLFPDRDGGLVAMMRLSEVGINDTPELENMFSVFKGPANFKTAEIYNKIIRDHPDSELVPLARLKLAMWYFVNNRYEEALSASADLARLYPRHELVPYAEEVALKAFSALAAEGAMQNRTGQVVASWSAHPIIRKQEESLSPGSRVALAISMEKQNDPDGALKMLNPLFLGLKDPDFAEQGLHLALSIYLEHDMWPDIEKLADHIVLWELTPSTRDQLDYALALAHENQDKSAAAVPLWSRLANAGTLSEDQQAQAEYFLAQDAKNTNRLQEAYILGRSSLNRFLQTARANPEKAATGRINSLRDMLMGVSEISGRFDEALGYANDYLAGLPDSAPQRPSILTSMARIYRKKGDIPEWRRLLTEVRDKYPGSVYGKTAASALSSAQITQDAAKFSSDGQL